MLRGISLVLSLVLGVAPALGQLPSNYRVTFENTLVQVVHVRYGPHEKLALHEHSLFPTIYVYLTESGPVRFSHIEDKPFAITRAPVKPGWFRVSPGRLEKHTVENLGAIPSEFLRIELKQLPLGVEHFHFRGNKPFDLSKTGTTAEFDSPNVSVQRLILAKRGDVQKMMAERPVLLVALSPCLVRDATATGRGLRNGDVYWLEAGQSASLEKSGDAPAHLLLITLMK